ncbi:flippase [Bacteroides heparinolyticus]|uniref:flippase n=1 Tax=Prevotella heparinolytica TaxID=28113 RepID=UPI0023F1BC67|nr:flippase [Bacteroides heparinolyticus]
MLQRLFTKFNTDSTRGKIIRNVFWAVTGKIVTLFSTLIVGIFVARYLGPEQYGLMNYVISIVSLFTVFATFGSNEIVIRELAKKELSKEIILGSAMALRLSLAMICFIGIGIYLLLGNESIETSILILIYSSTIFFSCSEVIRFYFTSIVENEYIVKSEIFRTIIGALIKIILLLCKAPLIAFVFALALDFILLAGGYLVVYKRRVGSIRLWSVDFKFVRTLLSTSFPLLISSAAVIVYQRIDQVMIAKMLDNESVGYFSTAMSFVNVMAFIPVIIMQTTSPILVGYWKNDKQKYERESQRLIGISTWILIILCSIVALLSNPIISYTYGESYLAAIPVLQILVFKVVGITIINLSGQLIIIENIHQLAFIRNILSCVVCIVCNYYFIPRWGIIGSAWATIITVFFTGEIGNIFIPQYHHILKKQNIALLVGWKYLFNK